MIAVDTLLVETPEVCGGRLRIDGTRITVLQLATLYRQGWSAEDIRDSFAHLTLAQVYLALAYYHSHRAEIEDQLAAEQAEAERLERLFSSPVSAA